MGFDIDVWKEKTKARLSGWHARWVLMRNSGTAKVYPILAAAAFLPLIPALQEDPVAVGVALGGVLSAVGSKLLVNMIQGWKDEATATRELEQALSSNADLREQVDMLMQKLDVVSAARATLPEAEQAWFTETLNQELAQMGNLQRYAVMLKGDGAINLGSGDALGAGAVKIGGSVGGNVVTGTKRN